MISIMGSMAGGVTEMIICIAYFLNAYLYATIISYKFYEGIPHPHPHPHPHHWFVFIFVWFSGSFVHNFQ